jgi:hypothetical protein|tara:strand:+ start:34 stop:468 length:435 start_codon:yes stop_codon:yes gene_type:complete
MSLRNQIADNIVEVLKDIANPRPVLVTREPFDVEKLAITQFPAILVQSGSEERDTETMGVSGHRRGTIIFQLRGFQRGTELDNKRNQLIEAIEEQLDSDRYRGKTSGQVQNSMVTSVEVIERLAPLAEFVINFEVTYYFVRGSA